MKKNIFRAVVMSGLVMLAVASAQAQRRSLTVNVPFDFNAGEKTLRAGAYTLTELTHGAYVIRSADRETAVIVRAGASAAERNARGRGNTVARLVFRKYEDQNFLAQVWLTAGGDGRELHRSAAERRLADELKAARNQLKPQLVVITAAQK